MEERTASRASSAERLVASFPRAIWMASMRSALFMAGTFVRMHPLLGKRKSTEIKGIFLKWWLDFVDVEVLGARANSNF